MTDTVKNNPRSDGSGSCVKSCRGWRRRVLVASLIVLVFVSGAVVGGASTGCLMMRRFHFRPKHPDQIPNRVVHHMRRKFDLTDDQARQIHMVMSRKVDAMCGIHRDLYPKIESEMKRAEDEIAQILTPDQASEWRQWFSKRFHRRWRPPPPRSEQRVHPRDGH